MNAFERHSISHLSCSSLNLWKEAPGIWAMKYLKKALLETGAGMWRGNAVEDGLSAVLRGFVPEAAGLVALQSFELNAQGEISDEIEAERALIVPMVTEAARWKAPSELMATQLKIEHWFPEIPIPVIGYLDFAFECRDVDLKSTKACPSTPRPDHVRQVSLYRAARNRPGGLLYVTSKKHAYFEISDSDMVGALSDLENDAHCLFNFLSRMNNADDALNCLPINKDHFQYPKQQSTKEPIPPDILMAG